MDRVYEGQGWGIRNKYGERLLEFTDSSDMMIGNTFFEKDSEKLITFESGDNSSVIMLWEKLLKRVRDVKVIPGKECFLEHRIWHGKKRNRKNKV